MNRLRLSPPDAEIAYRYREGEGPVVAILHGIGGSSIEEYRPLFEAEALARRPLLAIDLLGYGHSEKTGGFSYELADQVEALARLFDALSLPRLALLGHSLGGTIALLFSQKYPERVSGLALAEGGLSAPYLTVARWAARYPGEAAFAQEFSALSGGAAGTMGAFALAPTLAMTDAVAFWRTSRSLIRHATGPALAESFFAAPLYKEYWIGEQSIERWGRAFIADLERHGVPYRIVAGASHALVQDNPGGFAEAAAGFFTAVEKPCD